MLKHNSYFDNQVQSIGFERNGLPASVGVIAAGSVHQFGTANAERMTVTSGRLRVRLREADWMQCPAGTYFEVAADSSFEVEAVGGAAAYLCEYLPRG